MANKKKAPARKEVERIIDVDITRLFDVPLLQAASYLMEVQAAHPGKDLHLVEHWHGYEDNEFRFVYEELESDEEYEHRIEEERLRAERDREELERKAKVKAIDFEIELLNRKRRSLA